MPSLFQENFGNMRSPSLSSSISNQTAAGSDGCSTGKKAETSCCSNVGMKRGPWTAEEDELLSKYVKKEGEGRWRTLPKKAGLMRCGKSCRLRWMNYLRPCVKRGDISADEEDLILRLHRLLGNRWSLIAGRIPGRTDNEIKNYWNTHLSKKLISQGIDPKSHKPMLNHINTLLANKQCFPELQPVVPNSYHVPVSPRNEKLSNDVQLTGDVEYCTDKNDGSKKDLGDGNVGTSYSKECGNNGEDDINLLVPDEAFSSFLNSLINDDMFNTNKQMQEQDQVEEVKHHISKFLG